ncbi:MAG: TerC family protein [Verrucomicrobia bacterium]|nr:TerC family protein [Verrucomicrobiota bacterium]
MLSLVDIRWPHWVGFVVGILLCLALDLGVFHRHARVVKVKEALAWTTLWVTLSLLFAVAVWHWRGAEEGKEFLTGYIIELSLSMDNVFVIALIFSYFRIPRKYQHEVLFWGIMGALVMRGVMIYAGASLVERFDWVLMIFGAFLLYSGAKIAFTKEDSQMDPEKNPVLRLVRKFYPVTSELHGEKFIVRTAAGVALTPLALVLIVVETTDLIFALDSIPAIFGITQKKFIIFTSNVFAILGLRSMYFLLAGAVEYFRYLKAGLSFVLVFIGVKMLIAKWYHIGTDVSLTVVVGILGISMAASWWSRRAEMRRP